MPIDEQAVLDRLIRKIETAPIDPRPSDNIYMEDVFDPALYDEILRRLPANESYDFIDHPDAKLPDGTSTRMLLALDGDTLDRIVPDDREFWRRMWRVLTSETLTGTLTTKFAERITGRFQDRWPEMVMVPIFYRDFPGYYIGIHPDAPYKIATMQFYLPKDESQIHLGTSFHDTTGERPVLKTNLFKPNSAYAFVRTDDSLHSVGRMGAYESARDTLALTMYVKGQEYKSPRT